MQYSKYNSPEQVIHNDVSSVRAVCDADLKAMYYERLDVHLYLGVSLVLPVIVMLIIAVLVRRNHVEIQAKLAKPSNHHNLAGLVLTGLYVMLFVIVMDFAAVVYSSINSHEYGSYDVVGTFNLTVSFYTLLFDGTVFAYSFLATLLYGLAQKRYGSNKLVNYLISFSRLLFVPFFYAIFGYKKQNKIWDADDSNANDLRNPPVVYFKLNMCPIIQCNFSSWVYFDCMVVDRTSKNHFSRSSSYQRCPLSVLNASFIVCN